MKKKLSAIIALLALPSVCEAAVYYNDPSCSENGNGTSFMCAESAGGAGAYNTWAGVTFSGANYYLQKAGTTESSAYINIAAGGTDAANRLVLGSYTTGGELTTEKAYLDGDGNGQNRVIQSAAGVSHWVIQDLDITYDRDGEDVYAYGIACPSSGGDTTVDYDNTIQRVRIHDIKNGDQDTNKVASGIVATFNGGLHLIDVTVENVDTDCVQGGGDNLEVFGGLYQYSGLGSAATGDELQITGDNMWVHGTVVRHADLDEKQCMILTGDNAIVEDSFFYGFKNGDTSSSLHRPVYMTGDSGIFRRNYVEGTGVSSILYTTSTTTNFLAYHNTLMVYGTGTGAISAGGNDATLLNNTAVYKGTAVNTAHGVRQLDAITGGVATNNIFSGFATGVLSTNMAESYNTIYGATKECADSFGTERDCGTGTITVDPHLDAQGRPTAKTPATVKRGGTLLDGYASIAGKYGYIGAYPYYEGTITPWNIALSIMGGSGQLGGGPVYTAPVSAYLGNYFVDGSTIFLDGSTYFVDGGL